MRTTTPKNSTFSLKSKLVLSYLLVILGTVLVLSFAVSVAVQNYFYSLQVERLNYNAALLARSIITYYRMNGSDWNNMQPPNLVPNDQVFALIVDNNGKHIVCSNNNPVEQNNCDNSDIAQALKTVLQSGNASSGSIQLTLDNYNGPVIYASVPLQYGNQTIGAVFIAQPRITSGYDVLSQINQSIILASLGVAAIAALCSYLFVRRFVRPLELLTTAAEDMKHGRYTRRVAQNFPQDEVGLLAQTFNEMADTIEADVTELRRQDQMRRDLIANIAHDLATPLTAIQGLSEALADDVISDPESRQETAQRIGREVQRLRRLVADVRQMTMLEAGQIRLDLAPLDLNSLVDETVAVMAPECEELGIKLQNAIPTSIPYVEADSDRITQILLNLLDNARRHTNEGGRISVGAVEKDGQLRVSISDTGVGIDKDDLPHIFERFYRADRSRAAKTGGSGLGLAIVKAIVTAHNGQVWAESTPGKGTTVIFTLPLAQQLPQQAKQLLNSIPASHYE
ncbi:sensor histidine kinase [Dictyobacter formicarum]|uniref:histidine kinase n=1 Tax=Dictyobacter formicarum TaxID=2778368 RepID=A0ABQ3VKC3_9CHLR|nr:HAMP domain-containing sensor histidine kinase [Dictyobacter formicarum]GHO86545.1 hypothetical protein KSZ_45510 [Dictyobacter formicarum]